MKGTSSSAPRPRATTPERAFPVRAPMPQIPAGRRAILYFGGRSDADLTRGLVAAGLRLTFWLVPGSAVVRWYDHRQLFRMRPDLLTYVSRAVQGYRAQAPDAAAPGGGAGHTGQTREGNNHVHHHQT